LPGDEVFSSAGGWLKVANGAWMAERQTVYNFKVEGYHTYFVGQVGAWVHNGKGEGDKKCWVDPGGGSKKQYKPTKKHQKGGWGTEMDLDDATAQKVLDDAIPGGKQQYGIYNGKVYEFQPDNTGGWHGYPIPGNQAPPSVLKKMLKDGRITKNQYKKLIKGKQ
jgi:hypothetical protein